MNKTFICALIVLNLAFSNAVFLKKPSQATFTVFNQLKAVEDVGFGKKILDTIALQLKNKSPLGDIAKMLAEIRTDLTMQQKDSDNLHAQQEAECEAEITEYNRRIDTASTNRAEAESTITTLKSEIAALNGEIKNKGAQLDILNNREVSLKESREQDAADFATRQAQSVEVVGALELIIEKLSTIAPHEDNSEAALVELAKIGGSNPIMALVQVAMTFSAESLERVVNKLDELRQNLETAIEDDKAQEQAALGEFESLLSEIETTRKMVAQAKSDAESRLKQTEGALSIQEKKLEEAIEELKSANEGKVAKTAQCEEWRVKYETERTQRTKEISVVREVENIIATKLETMKDYLKERVNGDDE